MNANQHTVQLIEAASDTHLFSQNYDRDFDDIFAIQDEVAEKVVDELHLTLLTDMPKAKRVNPQAYALYLQARSIFNDSNADENERARIGPLLERALEIDPDVVLAQIYAWIGDKDEAFRLLGKHSREDTYQIRDHLTRPWYRKLYDDPRWMALLEQYEMTDEKLAGLDFDDLRLPPGVEL